MISRTEKIVSGILWGIAVILVISQLIGCGKVYLEPVEQLPIEEMFVVPVEPMGLIEPKKEVDTSNTQVLFTNWNKFWLGTAVAGQVADTLTTFDKLDDGYIEANPLFGTNPEKGVVIASKVVATSFVIWMAEFYLKDHPKQQEYRNWIYGTFGVIGGSFALWNSLQ